MRRALPLFVTLFASGIAGCAHTHLAAGTLVVATPTAPATVFSATVFPTTVYPATAFHQYQRTVWSDQVVWTRQYVAAVFANDRSARVDLIRLTRNNEAIGQTIKPYYGATAGEGLTTMLNVQVNIAWALIQAVKSDNTEQKEQLEGRLHENSSAIARYLAGLNPHWSPAELESIFNSYVDASALNVITRKGERLDSDETAIDGSVNQAKKLADLLSDGIARQFPYGPPYYPRDSH